MKLKVVHIPGPDNIERSVEVIPHPIRDFQHAGFHSVIQKSIDIAGFKSPTAIQAQAWPVIYRGLDLIGIAPTGSGKTLAYTLPALSKCLNSSVSPPTTVCEPSALIIVPTRELATQVFEDAQFFADAFANLLTAHMHDHSQEIIIPSEVSENKVRIALVAGGSNYKMMMGADIAVATIGRLFDVICKGVFHVRRVCYFVLDEADKLLSSEGDFIEYIRLLCSKMPRNRQSLLFSATFMDDVERLSDVVFKKDSIMIKSTEKPCVAQNIRQVPLIVNDSLKKQKMLLGFCNTVQGCKILVLVNTKKGVDMLYELLNAFGIPCVFSHGDVDSNARNAVLSIFKKDHRLAIADFNKIRDNQSLRTFEATLPLVMIATDVYGRGIDIKDLPYVINYDSPKTYDDYIQRCGRVGRSSNKGTAITFLDRNASEECLSCIWERGSANIDEGILERLKNKDEYLLPESINSIYVPSTDRETRSRNPIWNENNNGNSNDRNDYNQGWTDSKNNINNNQGRWDDNNNYNYTKLRQQLQQQKQQLQQQ
eukprot:GDKJ01048694.1.p1 GENE.GDKJ01048694.1~~GDKJ01048694.1.p1  ORF type:complete len:612 (+),score=111.13 GDKJ01048694.1:224-1837(+)